MNDVTKTVGAVLVTGIMQSVITTQTVSVEIVNMKSSVEKLDKSVNERINKLDERVLDTQLKQAQYLAAN
tara:strand:+ start:11822 stop:12031 length:210 start_codon:yes stop_codon:yes gene_type:complete